MSSLAVYGFAMSVVAGILAGGCAAPIKLMRRYRFEHWALVAALVGVIGLGYVGLPLVREFARGGARVLGFDVDAAKVKALKAGRSYIEHIPGEMVRKIIRSGQFAPTCDFARLGAPDCILICVPTPPVIAARS